MFLGSNIHVGNMSRYGSGGVSREAGRHTITANGDAQLDGDGSVTLNGTNAYLSAPNSDDWNLGTQDFTWEGYINTDRLTGANQVILNSEISSTAVRGLTLQTGSSDGLKYTSYTGNWAAEINMSQGGQIGLSASTWIHIACSKTDSVYKAFIDGIETITTTDSDSQDDGINMIVGAIKYGATVEDYFVGKMSRIICSNGIGRYTTNFTPAARTDAIVIDEYVKFAPDLSGSIGSTTIPDLAWKDEV